MNKRELFSSLVLSSLFIYTIYIWEKYNASANISVAHTQQQWFPKNDCVAAAAAAAAIMIAHSRQPTHCSQCVHEIYI